MINDSQADGEKRSLWRKRTELRNSEFQRTDRMKKPIERRSRLWKWTELCNGVIRVSADRDYVKKKRWREAIPDVEMDQTLWWFHKFPCANMMYRLREAGRGLPKKTSNHCDWICLRFSTVTDLHDMTHSMIKRQSNLMPLKGNRTQTK